MSRDLLLEATIPRRPYRKGQTKLMLFRVDL